MKILNLYAGIGGNRKLWGDSHQVTAIEMDKETSNVYKKYFPNDTVINADAHQYLLEHYKEFDFIWSSPPCPTHSKLNFTRNGRGDSMKYPDMALYQQILFLHYWFKGLFVIENVIPYYKPLIPAQKLDRHLWWANFKMPYANIKRPFEMAEATVKDYEDFLEYDLSEFKLKNKIKNLRNCVIPATGRHILDSAERIYFSKQQTQGVLNFEL